MNLSGVRRQAAHSRTGSPSTHAIFEHYSHTIRIGSHRFTTAHAGLRRDTQVRPGSHIISTICTIRRYSHCSRGILTIRRHSHPSIRKYCAVFARVRPVMPTSRPRLSVVIGPRYQAALWSDPDRLEIRPGTAVVGALSIIVVSAIKLYCTLRVAGMRMRYGSNEIEIYARSKVAIYSDAF